MELIIPIVCLLIIGILIALFIIKRNSNSRDLIATKDYSLAVKDCDLIPKFEELSLTAKIDESKLVEIKDTKLIQRFIDHIPNTSLALNNYNNAKQYQELVKDGGKLYQVIIPRGTTLDKSREIAGASRASFRGIDNKIKGNANLIPADELANKMAISNLTNAGYNLAAAVVGQHYMAEIDAKLETISKDIAKITAFQKNKYHAKVEALIAKVYEFSKFQLEILESDALRNERITSLQQSKDNCTELLGIANKSIENILGDTISSYKDYEDKLTEVNGWYQYQKILSELLYRISELDHTLHLGTMSKELCYQRCDMYAKQVEACQNKLIDWHKKYETQFKIDIDSAKRKRTGFEAVFIKPLAWMISDDLNYKTIKESTATMIETQSHSTCDSTLGDTTDLFQQDAHVIAKDGKLYYLPQHK